MMRLVAVKASVGSSCGAVRARLRAATFFISAVFVISANCAAQAVTPSDQWGDQHDSPGATLTYKETERKVMEGRTFVTYDLFASGLPSGGQYVLSARIIGTAPVNIGDVYLSEQGKVVKALADPAHNLAEDPAPINLMGSKGEPFQFAVVSADGKIRVFTRIVPFPIESGVGPCHLSIVELMPAYVAVLIEVSGLLPNEGFVIEYSSEHKGGHKKLKAGAGGTFRVALSTEIKGKRSGTFEFQVKAHSCNIGMQLPWGIGSEKFQ